jgi:uncharacterized protein YjbI with pentapeptide repeats
MRQRLLRRWSPTPRQKAILREEIKLGEKIILRVLVLAIFSFFLVLIFGYLFNWTWTGFVEAPLSAKKTPAKLLWDWLQLLIVPLALAIVGFWYGRAQRNRELEIEQQRAQDEALQAYLDQMRGLLLSGELRQPEEQSAAEAITLVRAQTLTLLQRLDARRKASVIRFLDESGLIQKTSKEAHVSVLNDADMSGINLSNAKLRFAVMRRTELSNANLSGAKLRGADLRAAVLRGADLSGAYLGNAKLRRADLSGADLSNADLTDVDLSIANLSSADLSGTYRDIKGKGRAVKPVKQLIANEELEQQTSSLQGATMPNGQKYEDWLKSKGSGEHGENTGPS